MGKKKIDERDVVAEKIIVALSHIQSQQRQGTDKSILIDLALGRFGGWYVPLVECYVDFGTLERNDRRIAAMRAARTLKIELPDECYDAA